MMSCQGGGSQTGTLKPGYSSFFQQRRSAGRVLEDRSSLFCSLLHLNVFNSQAYILPIIPPCESIERTDSSFSFEKVGKYTYRLTEGRFLSSSRLNL